SLDVAGWKLAEPVLASLATECAQATRMEEANSWRHPVDVVAILERAFEQLPSALSGHDRSGLDRGQTPVMPAEDALLGEDPQQIADDLLAALAGGATAEQVAGAVARAAAVRIARFHTSNEFSDWDRALHTFTFAN